MDDYIRRLRVMYQIGPGFGEPRYVATFNHDTEWIRLPWYKRLWRWFKRMLNPRPGSE